MDQYGRQKTLKLIYPWLARLSRYVHYTAGSLSFVAALCQVVGQVFLLIACVYHGVWYHLPNLLTLVLRDADCMTSNNFVNTPPIYGNYHNYYSKRPFVRDPRLALLPPDFFANTKVLDIGCNEGWVTCEIAQSWSASKVVGVDIDDSLVRAAWRRRRTIWSLQGPSETMSTHSHDSQEGEATSQKRKRPLNGSTEILSRGAQPDYFPVSCEHEFDSLPVPPSKTRGKHTFPHNVSFRTADWTSTEIPEDVERYNVVIAFSISKWIHLNGGDEALERFLCRVYDVLEPGGSFVLEPQPWDTYAKAKRMSEKLKENARSLRIRPDEFENILVGIGFSPARHYGTTGEGGFRRPVDVYCKP